jgi:transcriptional regulator with XRE-family HTH domain
LPAASRKQGLTQEQTAARLGVSRSWIGRLEVRNANNAQSVIICKPGRPTKVSPEKAAAIPGRLASGETQAAVAADLGITQQAVGKIAQASHARANRRDVGRFEELGAAVGKTKCY